MLLYCLSAILLCSCSHLREGTSFHSPAGYSFSTPTIIHLKSELNEISGIAYYAKDSSLFAIQDELGRLYKIRLLKKIKIDDWKFSIGGDYEDVVLLDSTFYILQGPGNISAVRFLSKKSIQLETFQLPALGINNFETLYYDDSAHRLVMVCKNCKSDGKSKVSAFAFNPYDNTFDDKPFYALNIDAIANLLGEESIKLKPSAAAIHPLTGELYIVSSVEKILLIANRNGVVRSAFYLDPKFFKQPEGICFTPNGDMFISNEFARVGAATILLYKYKPYRHEKD